MPSSAELPFLTSFGLLIKKVVKIDVKITVKLEIMAGVLGVRQGG